MAIKIRTVIMLIFLFALSALAYETDAFAEEQLEASGAYSLYDSLSDEDIELLEALGIEGIDFDSVFEPSARNLPDFFFKLIRNEYTSPVNCFAVLCVCVFALSAVGQFVPDDSKTSRTVEFMSGTIASLCMIVPLSSCITRAISAISVSSNFVTALIPVLAAVITVSGNPMLALTYNSLSFAAAQVVSRIGEDVVRPVIQVVMSLSIISSVSASVNIEKIVDFAKKTVIFIMSFSATVFVTFLTVKGMLAASADNVGVRGIRFLIGSIIPVVGVAVSDAYLSIVGTLGLVKNTVGVFAIAAVAVINLPVITECVLWILMLNLLALLGDMFSQGRLSSLFRAVSSAVVLLTVTVVFEMLVFVLSVGLILVIKGNG